MFITVLLRLFRFHALSKLVQTRDRKSREQPGCVFSQFSSHQSDVAFSSFPHFGFLWVLAQLAQPLVLGHSLPRQSFLLRLVELLRIRLLLSQMEYCSSRLVVLLYLSGHLSLFPELEEAESYSSTAHLRHLSDNPRIHHLLCNRLLLPNIIYSIRRPRYL